jgi:hypothetical protein
MLSRSLQKRSLCARQSDPPHKRRKAVQPVSTLDQLRHGGEGVGLQIAPRGGCVARRSQRGVQRQRAERVRRHTPRLANANLVPWALCQRRVSRGGRLVVLTVRPPHHRHHRGGHGHRRLGVVSHGARHISQAKLSHEQQAAAASEADVHLVVPPVGGCGGAACGRGGVCEVQQRLLDTCGHHALTTPPEVRSYRLGFSKNCARMPQQSSFSHEPAWHEPPDFPSSLSLTI